MSLRTHILPLFLVLALLNACTPKTKVTTSVPSGSPAWTNPAHYPSLHKTNSTLVRTPLTKARDSSVSKTLRDKTPAHKFFAPPAGDGAGAEDSKKPEEKK
jgi:hypothetical protein